MIRERHPMDLANQLEPKTSDKVTCLNCGATWVAERPISVDYHKLECGFCGQQDSELSHECPALYVFIH